MDDELHLYNESELCEIMIIEKLRGVINTKSQKRAGPRREEILEYLLELDDSSPDVKKLKEVIIFNMDKFIGR